MNINIAIPCFNEAENIVECVNNIKSIDNSFDITVVNDGSTDDSLSILREIDGVRILSSNRNFGLASVFNSIIFDSNLRNYDYLVIFDADNQYPHKEIKQLILETNTKKLDICIGSRNFKNNNVFSKTKNLLQITGSKIVSTLIGIKITDATSGFRCYSRNAFEDLFILNNFSYTIESLFVAKKNNLTIGQYKLSNFYKTRESRLFKSNNEYISKTFKIIFNSLLLYKRNLIFKFYLIFLIPGLLFCSRFIINYIENDGYSGNIQSLVLGTSNLIIVTSFYSLLVVLSYSKTNIRELFVNSFKPKHKSEI